ncbi:MAG: DUF3786 domain-containing protein [Ruminococcaceae bacterium]|nr:DUF3786 domain-containing protein [Oscillospiraceae bacterium]
MDNYEISRNRAQDYFLNFDQKTIIERWDLQHDTDYLYVDFVGRPYRVSRKTGKIDRLFDGKEAGFSEVLSIFDLLCHRGKDPFLTGRYAPVNSLRGCPVSVGVDTEFYGKTANFFDREPLLFDAACHNLGGISIAMGDIGFTFRIFDEMQVILKFYHSDEDFPASLTFLWDENTLNFIYYETVFYIAGFLLNEICREMRYQQEEI